MLFFHSLSLSLTTAFALKFLGDFWHLANCEGSTNEIDNHRRQRGAREAKECAETSVDCLQRKQGLSLVVPVILTALDEAMCWNSAFWQTAQDCNHNSIVEPFTLNVKEIRSVTTLCGKLGNSVKLTSDKQTHTTNCSSWQARRQSARPQLAPPSLSGPPGRSETFPTSGGASWSNIYGLGPSGLVTEWQARRKL